METQEIMRPRERAGIVNHAFDEGLCKHEALEDMQERLPVLLDKLL